MSKPENVKCPECGGGMVSRSGKYGIFWGCRDYPNCKGTRDSMGRSKYDRENERERSEPDWDELSSSQREGRVKWKGRDG